MSEERRGFDPEDLSALPPPLVPGASPTPDEESLSAEDHERTQSRVAVLIIAVVLAILGVAVAMVLAGF